MTPFVTLVRGPLVTAAHALNTEATPALGVAYLLAVLRQAGVDCTFVDGVGEGLEQRWPVAGRPYMAQGLALADIVRRVPAQTTLIGLTSMFSGDWPVLRELATQLRQWFPTALIVAGGEHITALPEYCLHDCPALDMAVRGEGEATLLALAQGETTVPGTAYLNSLGQYVEVGGLPRTRAVDALPWPHWPDGYLERFWAAGKSFGTQSARDMPLLATRGCPYRCTFCSSPQMWTTAYVLRDVEDVIAEIKAYIARYAITSLQYYDLTAITKKSWIVRFCTRLLEEGIHVPWSLPSGTRSEALDAETLTLLKRTGCTYLVYAPESGSQATLEIIKKRMDLAKLTASVLEAKRLGLVIRTNLIIGFPHETRRDIWTTLRYGLYLAWKGADEVTVNIFSPYPGTELFAQLIADGTLTVNDDYFYRLASLNSDFFTLHPLTVNPHVGRIELAGYRTGFMWLNYLVGYLRYPRRIGRSLANLWSGTHAATVLEHRLNDALRRWPVRRLKQAGAWGVVVVVYWYSYVTILTTLAGVAR